MSTESFLVVDKDTQLSIRVGHYFGAQGHEVQQAASQAAAIKEIERHNFDVVIADVRTTGAGMEGLLHALKSRNASAVVIVMSEPGESDEAMRAIREGATDFIHKPINLAEMDIRVSRARDLVRLSHERQVLRGERDLIYRTADFVGQSPAIKLVHEVVDKVARSNSSVILFGETGTGKELLAGAIHYSSARAGNAFVRVNCATLPETLLESELFGHERGAFTGAEKLRIGRFEQANGGSMFLDEIADVSPAIQAKLLRVLQEHEFERLGSNRTIKVDVRMITATNKDLGREISEGRFRADLYYRLNVVTISIPPLRERAGDVELLAAHFLRRYATDLKKRVIRIDPSAMRLLAEHRWPGNIRELKNVIERAVIMAESEVITPVDLNLLVTAAPGHHEDPREIVSIPREGLKWDEMERDIILQALERSGWVQKDAARLLGLTTRVFNYKIRSFGITHPTWRLNR